MSPMAAMTPAAAIAPIPGMVMIRRTWGPSQELLGDGPVHQAELTVEEVDVAEAGLHRFAFVGREALGPEPGPPPSAEQVAHRGPPRQRALQDGVDLVLGPGALAHQVGVPRHQAP